MLIRSVYHAAPRRGDDADGGAAKRARGAAPDEGAELAGVAPRSPAARASYFVRSIALVGTRRFDDTYSTTQLRCMHLPVRLNSASSTNGGGRHRPGRGRGARRHADPR